MKFFDELRKGVKNYVAKVKQDMAAKSAENKVIKDIESKAAFEERKNQAVKTAKFRVQLKGKKDREIIKNPNKNTFGTGTQPGNMFDMPQEKQTKTKKQKQNKQKEQEMFNPYASMDMVNFNPFKTR